jgi:hypothetical protein
MFMNAWNNKTSLVCHFGVMAGILAMAQCFQLGCIHFQQENGLSLLYQTRSSRRCVASGRRYGSSRAYVDVEDPSRRRGIFQSLLFTINILSPWIISIDGSFADGGSPDGASTTSTILPETNTILSGRITLPPDIQLGSDSAVDTGSTPALYVTCRPNTPDNVPQGILSGTRGKPPPVLAARFENPSFPFDFELVSPRHLTPEGAYSKNVAGPATQTSQFWWAGEDLVVSARWDSDGVAATRSPDDLVGRAVWKYISGTITMTRNSSSSADNKVEIQLTGRGTFGKLVTGNSSK